jgi:hypothetical protein
MQFDELVRAFAAQLGVDDMAVVDGTAGLAIDGNPFGFIHDEAAGTLTLVADIGRQPESADGPLGSMMLKANFLYKALDGAVLFQNPENEAFGIQQRFRLVDLDVESLSAQVERLANLAEDWRAIVAGYGRAAKTAQEQAAQKPRMDPLAANDFMRV